MAFLLRSRDFNFMTDKTIMKTWKIISSLNRNGSIDMSKVKQFIQNVCALIKRFCIFSKRNTLYNPSHDASIQIFHLSYKAHDFFCFLLIFDHPWTLNSIMDEDNEKIKEQPEWDSNDKSNLREIFFKKNLLWNVDGKQSNGKQ